MKNTYWSKKGKHQKTYDRLEKLIPDNGRADSMHIELLRCASNLYHDFYNNGAGNLSVYKDQILFIQSWAEEVKSKMLRYKGESPFDKIIGECIEDANDENRRYISTMIDNSVSAIYDGLEEIMDAVILVAKEREQNSKFIIINASMGGWLDGTKKVKKSNVIRQAIKCSQHYGREEQCRKWFKDAQPGDCLVLDPTCGVFCVNKVQNLRDVK